MRLYFLLVFKIVNSATAILSVIFVFFISQHLSAILHYFALPLFEVWLNKAICITKPYTIFCFDVATVPINQLGVTVGLATLPVPFTEEKVLLRSGCGCGIPVYCQ